jgi:SAM-dependent methyltransferase
MTSQTAPDHWNHNVHYQPAVLGAVPPVCGAALDVGCAEVTGIDPDAPMIAQAQQRAKASAAGNVTFVAADFLAYPFADGSFDFACAASPRRPARSRRPGRRQVGRRSAGRRGRHPGRALPPGNPRKGGPGGMPIADPDLSWRGVRAAASRVLPGIRYRRHLLWRYSLLWRKPPA